MRFFTARCPQCSEPPDYILESMLVHFHVDAKDGDHFEYNGQSQDWVETSEPVKDADGCVRVGCVNGHEWSTTITEE